jgi:hypothetical protein
MIFAHRAAKVMLDTSPVRRFTEGELVLEFAEFLGERAYAPPPVLRELRDIAGKFPDIDALLSRKWPRTTPEVPTRVNDDIFRLQKRYRPGDRRDDLTVNLGEIAAVQIAVHLGYPLLVADDSLAKALSKRKVFRLSTAQVAAEMVVLDKLDDEQGWRVWNLATPDDQGLTRRDYDSDVSRARTDYHLELWV